jgi:RNA polymerase sigma factor (TIGR02999 family)
MSANSPNSTPDVTRLLIEWTGGSQHAMEELLPLVYDELRRLAGSYLRRERSDHTLQSTALVHEAYLRMVDQRNATWQGRAHFFGIAAQMMRRILVDHARGRDAAKRGSGACKITLDEGLLAPAERDINLVALDQALEMLAKLDPKQARIVELRFFAGLSIEDAAEILKISPASVKREWAMAKAFLTRQMKSAHHS